MAKKSGSQTIYGGGGSDHLNGGSSDDYLYGLSGADRLVGGAGADTLDGGAGDDLVKGDAGDDVAVYVVGENAGARDVYDGGSHSDTLRLVMTRAEWMDPAFQADLARYLDFVAANTLPNGEAKNVAFEFSAFGLSAARFEKLEIIVDGVALDPRDQAVVLGDDAATATEDAPSVAIDLLANDSVPDLLAALTFTQPAHGTATLVEQTAGAPAGSDTARFVYTPDAAHWQHLAAGETATDTFTYTVRDADGDERTATVTVTIVGTNDAPTVTSAVTSGATVEDMVSSAAGAIAFADVDLSDAHTVSAAAQDEGYVGTFTATVADDSTGDGAGSVAWSFVVDPAQIQHLAAGEVLTQSYVVTVEDGNGGSVQQTVTVTITGTNDAPVIGAAVTTGATVEDGVAEASGVIAFADVDLTDGHAVASAAQGEGYVGTFTAVLADDSTGDGAGSVAWSFSVDPAVVQHLAAGQSLLQRYVVEVSDGHGGTVQQLVNVTIVGTNDAPVVSAITAGSTDEDAGLFTVDLLSTTSDVDALDDLDVQDVVVASSNGARAVSFTVDPETGALSLDPTQFNDLAAGERETVTVSYNVTDGRGGVVTNTATFVVEGRNDAPTVTPVAGGGTHEDAPPFTVELLSTASDVDASDDLDAQGVTVASSNGSRTVAFSVNAETGVLSLDPAQFNDLAVGQAETITVTYNVVDGSGGVVANTATIVVEGRNDGPVATPISGATDEDAAPVQINLLATASDADAGDDLDADSVVVVSSNAARTVAFTVDAETGAFSLNPAQFSDLAAGERETVTVTYNAVDGNGGVVANTATFLVEGRNDAPTVTPVAGGATHEDAASFTVELLSTASDVDASDDLDAQGVTVASSNQARTVAFSVNAETGAFSLNPAQFNDLAEGQSETITVSYSVADGKGGVVANTATFVVEGRNDAPVVRDVDLGGASVSYGGLVLGGYGSVGLVTSGLVDANRDGTPEQVGVYETLTSGSTSITGFAGGDLDGDGDLDVVAANNTGLFTFTNAGDTDGDGAANFVVSQLTTSSVGYDVGVADLNGDGRLDVVAGHGATLYEFINRGNVDGDGLADDFTQRNVSRPNQGANYGIATGDFNGDGRVDVISAGYSAGPTMIAYNLGDTNGDGKIDYSHQLIEDNYDENGIGVVVGDLDRDGDLDFVLSRWNTANEVVYLNQGDTNGDGKADFATVELTSTQGHTLESELGDIDGDGDLDIISADLNGTVRVTYNKGDQNGDGRPEFETQLVTTGGSNSYGLAVGDLDGDGDLDIVTASISGNQTRVLINRGDANGDGKVDFTSGPLTGAPAGWDAAFLVAGNTASAAVAEDGEAVTAAFDADDADSDDDAASLTYQLVSPPSEGVVTINGDGTFSFDPADDFQDLGQGETREITFTYQAVDAHGAVSNTSTVTLTVAGRNDGPVVTGESVTGVEDAPVILNVLANDTDVDGDALSVTAINGVQVSVGGTVSLGAGASVRLNADGTLSYTPPANATGVRTFTYTVSDGKGGTATATASVDLTPVNDAPVAQNDSASTGEDAVLVLAPSALLGNDTDVDGDALSVQSVSATSQMGATVSIDQNGNVVYDPSAAASLQALSRGQQAVDTFTYTVTDPSGATRTATVTVRVDGALEAPVANPDTVTVTEHGTASGNLVANDQVTGGTGATGNILVNPSFELGHSIGLNTWGSVGSLPGWTSTDVIEVWGDGFLGNRASDGRSFLELDSRGAQDAYSQTLTTTVGREYTLSFDLAQRSGTSAATNQVEFLVNGRSLGVFTPTTTTFSTFTVSFVGSGSDVITFREPASANNGVGGLIDNLRISAQADVFVTAVNGDANGIGHAVAGSNGGEFVLQSNGTYVFTAGDDFAHLAAGETATTSVTYTVTDAGGSSTSTVTVTVTGENDAPELASAVADQSADMLAAYSFTVPGDAFSDVDGDGLTYSAVLADGQPLPAWLSFDAATRTFSGTPQGADVGVISVRVTASDGSLSVSDTFDLTVNVVDQTLIGAAGAQSLTGDVGNDTVVGGEGDDFLLGGAGADVISGDVQNASGPAPTTAFAMTQTAASYLTHSHDLINGLGGARGFGEGTLVRNDDGSTGAIDITSVFGAAGIDFFGTDYTSIYVNNNGNITFNGPNGGYVPQSINAGFGNPIIAPFWNDIDTRNTSGQTSTGGTSTGSNQVYYDLDAANGVLTITWDDVGAYPSQNTPNAFQLQLINRGGGDFDIVFRYESINWTAASTSSITRAGYTAGDGAHYYELPQSGTGSMIDLENAAGNTGIDGVFVFPVRGGQVVSGGADVIDGGAGADTLIGGVGNDTFVFRAGEANGDTIVDFNGANEQAGDMLRLEGYGTLDQGASIVQLDATRWQITSADGHVQDVITIANGATVHSSDFLFI